MSKYATLPANTNVQQAHNPHIQKMNANTTHVYYATLTNGQGIMEHIRLRTAAPHNAARKIAEKHATGQGTLVEGLSLWTRSKIPTGQREAFNALSDKLQNFIAEAYFIKCHNSDWRLSYWEKSTWDILFEELEFGTYSYSKEPDENRLEWSQKDVNTFFKDMHDSALSAEPHWVEAQLDPTGQDLDTFYGERITYGQTDRPCSCEDFPCCGH